MSAGVPASALIHFALAVVCLFLAAMQVALWRMFPKDRLPFWTSLCLGGLGLLNLSIAGGARATNGAFGPPWIWVLLSSVAVVGMPGSLLTVWHILGVRVRHPVRLAFLVVNASGATLLGVTNLVWTATHAAAFWEDLDRNQVVPRLPEILGPSVSLVAFVEAFFAIRRGNPLGWAVLATSVVTMALGAIHAAGFTGTVQPIALTGFPLLVLATVVLVQRFRILTGREEAAGGYRLLRRLATGGMGELHLASRVAPGGFERLVALKRVLVGATDTKAVERLLAEARMAARLVHPNIVAVHDVGRIDGPEGFGWFIAMEYLPGADLKTLREASAEPLPVELVAHVGREACKGLAHAHDNGIVHRDISPHNLMVTLEGAVKIVDFGVAAQGGAPSDAEDYALGKIGYASPEQLRNGAIGGASDLFSLGVVLYELLAGERPFQGASAIETAGKVLRGDRPALASRRAGLPEALVAVVERALAGKPGERFADAREMGAALAAATAGLAACDPGAIVRARCGAADERGREPAAAAARS